MNLRFKLTRIFAVASSMTLLTGYVVYSHLTPNIPPPDVFGLSPGDTVRTSSLSTNLPANRPSSELRIISSKVINQPVFSVRKIHWAFIEGPGGRNPFVPLPRPYAPPSQERVGTWMSGYEMTGLSVDPLRKPAKP